IAPKSPLAACLTCDDVPDGRRGQVGLPIANAGVVSRVGIAQLDQVRQSRHSRSLRTVSLLRLGVVAMLFMAIEVGVTPHWRDQCVLLAGYLVVALAAATVAYRVPIHSQGAVRIQFGLAIVDVGVVFAYKQLSPPGAYIPLLMMTVVPMMAVLDSS